jgi:uncharacterized protein YqeY
MPLYDLSGGIVAGGAPGKAEVGKVMRPVLTALKGRADGGRIKRLVLAELEDQPNRGAEPQVL